MPTWGRGGAGNIMTDAQIEEENRRISADLEAQQSAAETFAAPTHRPSYPTTTTPTASQSQQYALSGRGGAGNWYSPADLASRGTFVSTTTATSSNSLVPEPSPLDPSTSNFDTHPRTGSVSPNPPPTASAPAAAAFAEVSAGHRGRGGAGNYVWDGQREEEEKLKREKEDRDREAEVREKAERDVETGLARPGRAKLEPGGRVGRGEEGGGGEEWREWV
ncbi:hypothetical protein W97_02681 [Coniosporium apollinis CBS 100218]|uniref:Uncharacterized protein n=1 Tax=Coniosporium apollinis (strain CBS 100218) TaxID=1168221 RepID=R7YNL0_CONA1|nr:uncharacterized protein W97_02681 [Coniosporium apollinis CBS 100218]EON63453.1 hypothetical protein W97_02681 [Coniosporium apollinis CBS 100218]